MSERDVRTIRLIGQSAFDILKQSKVAVFGVGGVGGPAAEALARSGIGAIDLIDRDVVEASNINRQIVADYRTIGRKKVQVMQEMVSRINPDCRVGTYDLFYLPETAEQIDLSHYDYIIDAIDTVTAKIELITRAVSCGVPIISSMGAGNRLQGSAFKVMDLSKTSIDPLAKVMRRELGKRGIKNLKVVCSGETPVKAAACDREQARTPGTVSFVPPVVGYLMAGEVVIDLISHQE